MARQKKTDLEFATEYDAAVNGGTPRRATLLLVVIVLMFSAGIAWAGWAELDEVTRGEGQVIPAGRNQVVQSLEGGIVEDILVRAGDHVAQGDLLLRIDDTGFASDLGELIAKEASLKTRLLRLRHELEGDAASPPELPAELRELAPETVAAELELHDMRRRSLAGQRYVLEERVQQRRRELDEIAVNQARLDANLELAREEEALKKPLAERGVVPRTDVIRLQREIADLEGQLAGSKELRPRLEAAVREAEGQVKELELRFREEAQAELSQATAEYAIVRETMRSARDRVVRTEIRAPVSGIVNKLNVNTIGGVVSAGENLVEIVPVDDQLRVEVKVRPSDIAFVHPNQPALVKISAYDFSIYGGLEGAVEKISADTSVDEDTREVFYLVTVRTEDSALGTGEETLSIIPGMVASVDIMTGKKTVLDYLLKPINKARQEALRER
ncbi:MAG TPA: HlyD family type I secretion periplasmic adaptor subunit [Aestuariivirgaceae bacterium]|nr:HlyD family type I secretion periplasmic adaptor subunit [Aestuariivirgaceae bacterium]